MKQPFPAVHSKLASLTEDQLILQLYTGAAVEVVSFSTVRATLISDAHQAKQPETKMIEGDIQQLDQNLLTVSFPISFKEGTRKNAVYLRFIMDISVNQAGQSVSGSIESENSNPFVVMTNQKQWEACERTLLLRDSFNGQVLFFFLLFFSSSSYSSLLLLLSLLLFYLFNLLLILLFIYLFFYLFIILFINFI